MTLTATRILYCGLEDDPTKIPTVSPCVFDQYASPALFGYYPQLPTFFSLGFWILSVLTIRPSTSLKVKMKTAILASLLASAAAFAPAKQAVKSSAVAASDFEDVLGAQPPLGLWDPLGLLNGADEERFDRLRYVEIKHGRISKFSIATN